MSSTGDLCNMLPKMLPQLWKFALRISGDKHDAEDLMQLACLRALERAYQLQPDTAPLSWMFSIVYSTWINEVRARRARSRAGIAWDDDLLDSVADPAARTPEENLMSAQIVSAVQRLPEPQRVAMLLVAIEGMSYKEAAEALDVPIGTIMSRLSRARQTIGAAFGVGKDPLVKRQESKETSVGRNG
ncbi:ECF subfamily RNA polymerase sigma-24 factor [Caballeronia udeis]|uniref:ECF subfamily RNA polymerase sigma-24 factor n=1 Tax=Caballeronia udeis TaxID=1232866 RepID=A0A158I9R0_9BURK|nr:RNA polymerase sigma factor [Caballeronia udeis]SAL52841.1 ECF subfamily RNA polymerase sigma-24 factor [Caballeronia udeis]